MIGYLAKDFVETPDSMCFAVVSHGVEYGRVRCFLRYVRQSGRWSKVDTDEANRLVAKRRPDRIFHSRQLAASMHGVHVGDVAVHHRPRERLAELRQGGPSDAVTDDLRHVCELLSHRGVDLASLGVTGSVLLGAQGPDSDIDLVVYRRSEFHRVRGVIRHLISTAQLTALRDVDWFKAFQRRDCDLTFAEYCFHEKRKFNKALINGRRLDISLIDASQASLQLTPGTPRKIGRVVINARVVDDSRSFDYPATFLIDHPLADEVQCFTATYSGQAVTGEWLQAAGQLEVSDDGRRRVIVGSTREARGEHVRVVGMPEMIEAVILDLDGLVLDTERSFLIARQDAAATMGLDSAWLAGGHLAGHSAEEVEAALAEHYGAGLDLAQFRALSERAWIERTARTGLPIRPGLPMLMGVIDRGGLPYAIATNSSAANAQACLQAAGLQQQFPIVVSSDQVAHGKPAPDVHLAAAELLAADIARCAVLEDSVVGLRSAIAAGAVAVHVPPEGARPAEETADGPYVEVRSLTEAAQWLARITRTDAPHTGADR